MANRYVFPVFNYQRRKIVGFTGRAVLIKIKWFHRVAYFKNGFIQHFNLKYLMESKEKFVENYRRYAQTMGLRIRIQW